MECSRDPEILAAFADGELAPAERAEVEVHLADCAACRAGLAAERRLGELFAALPPVEAPGDFEARFWGRIARERDATPSRAVWLRAVFSRRVISLAVGTAAVALLLVLPRVTSTPGSPAAHVPEADAPIVANGDDYELVQDPDMDAISVVDVLENWDDEPPS
ncbi:MAG TPA: zf-HC2 domain-containing protein [Myxococcota bacterium]|nr:zf-HC2 domain-containing protein [Myxococcota bacterium]